MVEEKKSHGILHLIADWSEKILSYAGMTFLVLMTLLVSFTVLTRYIFNFTFRWSDEVALLFMIWFGFLGIALGVKESIHLSIELFMKRVPRQYQKVLGWIENILVGYFGWFMFQYGLQLYNSTKITRLPATQWSRGLLFISVPLAGLFVLVYSVLKLIGILETGSEATVPVDDTEGKGGN